MLMLAVVLAEDFQVKYVSNKIKSAAEAHLGDGFFANAEDVFLHGRFNFFHGLFLHFRSRS
jgi:hypothetical protein